MRPEVIDLEQQDGQRHLWKCPLKTSLKDGRPAQPKSLSVIKHLKLNATSLIKSAKLSNEQMRFTWRVK